LPQKYKVTFEKVGYGSVLELRLLKSCLIGLLELVSEENTKIKSMVPISQAIENSYFSIFGIFQSPV
jgi:hypothetical protein